MKKLAWSHENGLTGWTWGLSFLVYLAISSITGINNTDLSVFYVPWGKALAEKGLSQIYVTTNCDYPPMFVYAFWLPGIIAKKLGITSSHGLGALYKTLPILALLLSARLAGRVCESVKASPQVTRRIVFFFLFNPALVYVSAVWGQTDTLLVMIFLAVLYTALKKQLFLPLFLSAVGFLGKPQMIFGLPFVLRTSDTVLSL